MRRGDHSDDSATSHTSHRSEFGRSTEEHAIELIVYILQTAGYALKNQDKKLAKFEVIDANLQTIKSMVLDFIGDLPFLSREATPFGAGPPLTLLSEAQNEVKEVIRTLENEEYLRRESTIQ